MSVHVKEMNGVYIVHPRFARLTATHGAREFRAALEKGVRDGYEGIAIDFSGVKFADREILHVLAAAYKLHAPSYGLMFAFHCSDDLEEFFEETLLDRLIPVVKDEEAALAVLAGCKRRPVKARAVEKVLGKAYAVGHRIGALPDRRVAVVNVPPGHERRRGARATAQEAGRPGVEEPPVAVQPEEAPRRVEVPAPEPPREETAAPRKRPPGATRSVKAQDGTEEQVLQPGAADARKKPKAPARKKTARAPTKKPEQGA
ncbi:MAG: hypothetical protein BWY06_02066 [Candidatus Latescibacteria bacterium ADurb.Bin168]|nr:MAG: hypothetical protein BWY06_02066 [Candidatus Latescibacteria bacterium ADurb.Bin168]